ncbi:MAG: hypothetical protein WA990_05630 [Rubrobacteraceae bacterium]
MAYLEYAYLAAALVLGTLLYWRRPGLYIGFTWWVWFLTPEVRRLVDYVSGWDPVNPIMLAPYLVSGLTFFTLVHHLPKLQLKRFFPFVLIFLGLFYAFAVGIYRGGVSSATYQLVEWLVPAVVAFYLIVHWRRYPEYRESVQRTFTWGVMVMGIYGLVQFLAPPAWDQYWMVSSPITSIGQPEPFEVRVFSTLNSPAPFAMVMMAGLLLLLAKGNALRWPAAAVGAVGFLLSLVRQAWGGWLIAVVLIVMQSRRSRPGLLLTLLVVTLLTMPLVTIGPIADRINERLGTLTELGQDNSFQARVEFYNETMPLAFLNPVGEGLGSTGRSTKLSTSSEFGTLGENAAFDSGIMEIPFVLGWPGSILYTGGLAWLLIQAQSRRNPEDLFATVSGSIAVSLLVLLIFNDTVTGLPGMLIWSFLGLAIAAGIGHRQTSRKPAGGMSPEKGYGAQREGATNTAGKKIARS